MTKKAIYIVEYQYGDRIVSDYIEDEADLTTDELYKRVCKELSYLNDTEILAKDIENIYPISEEIIIRVSKTL